MAIVRWPDTFESSMQDIKPNKPWTYCTLINYGNDGALTRCFKSAKMWKEGDVFLDLNCDVRSESHKYGDWS